MKTKLKFSLILASALYSLFYKPPILQFFSIELTLSATLARGYLSPASVDSFSKTFKVVSHAAQSPFWAKTRTLRVVLLPTPPPVALLATPDPFPVTKPLAEAAADIFLESKLKLLMQVSFVS